MTLPVLRFALGWQDAAPLQTQGVGRGYVVSCDLFRATIGGFPLEDISDLFVDGTVDKDETRDIKLAATFTLRQPARVTAYTDYLMPFLRREYFDGSPDDYEQVGLFAVTVPSGNYSPDDSEGTFQGSDLTSVLASAKYTDSSSSSSGTGYDTQIAGTISNGGISRYRVPTTTDTLPKAVTWPFGTSRLGKANGLCDQEGWEHLATELDGTVSTIGEPIDLADATPWKTIADRDVLGPIAVQPSGGIYNVVTVVGTDANNVALVSVARNDDPDSPTSTVSIGREISPDQPYSISGKTTQSALDRWARKYLRDARTYYRTAKLTLLHDPSALSPHQAVQLNLTGDYASLSGMWWINQASLGLTPSKPLTLTLNQLTDDLNGVRV